MSTLVQQRIRRKHDSRNTSCRVCDEIFRKTKTVLFFVTNGGCLWDIQIKCVSDHFRGTQRPNVSKYDRNVPVITKLEIETGVTK